jgi:thymidylate synthase (FAD)
VPTKLTDLHFVSLDWITPHAEAVVAEHARVSTKEPKREEYKKLLKYCIKHGHWSVYEQVCASFSIYTSRAVSAQIIRHRSFHYQELSQRYSDPTDVLSKLSEKCWDFDLRAQDILNRQNSLPYPNEDVKKDMKKEIREVYDSIDALYSRMLELGFAKECARNILPMCSPTRLHMQGTLRDWIFYVGLRARPDTQAEHRVIAKQIGENLADCVPVIHEALVESASDRIYAYFDDEELLDTLADNLKEILVTEYEHHKKRSAGLLKVCQQLFPNDFSTEPEEASEIVTGPRYVRVSFSLPQPTYWHLVGLAAEITQAPAEYMKALIETHVEDQTDGDH